jgi:hypothetical protein
MIPSGPYASLLARSQKQSQPALQDPLAPMLTTTVGTAYALFESHRAATPEVCGVLRRTEQVSVLFVSGEMVEAAGVEPASENVTGQETTCLFQFMPWALPQDVRGPRSERTRNASR